MREIVMDTETTGFDPEAGHKIIEIGAVELDNHVPTGRTYQVYINPERDVPADSIAVHGITEAFLKDKPVFSQIYMDFIEFIGDAHLVIHNAAFDINFLNYELKQVGHEPLSMQRVTNTLDIARRKFPGSPANLDALCRRFNIDLSVRDVHGALLDSQLLAEVYLELLGGRQHGLTLAAKQSEEDGKNGGARAVSSLSGRNQRPYREPRSFPLNEEERAAHSEMLDKLSAPMWKEAASS